MAIDTKQGERPGSSAAEQMPPSFARERCAPVADAEITAAVRSLGLAGHGPGSAAELLQVLSNQSLDRNALVACISAHPGIAATVVRVANSAYYGRSGQVTSIDQSAQLLGTSTLRAIAAAACFDKMSSTVSGAGTFDWIGFRRHSLACACAAQSIARRAAPQLASQMFLLGLLHDLGMLVQWRLRPRQVAFADRQGLAAGMPAIADDQAEIRMLGATRAHCTSVLLRHWRLPEPMCHAVGLADQDIEKLAAGGLPGTMLALADLLACTSGFPLRYGRQRDPAQQEALAAGSGLEPGVVKEITEALADEVEWLSGAMVG
ncbi:MAG: HDOD domain-containing protein [Pseudorhodoferax sp.]